MKNTDPGLHIHDRTKGVFPGEAVELFTHWTVRAVSGCWLLRGFRALPASTHIRIYTSKKASSGLAHGDGTTEIFIRPNENPKPGGDKNTLDGIDFTCFDWAEMLVAVVAHELAHLRGVPGLSPGHKHSKKMRIWATTARTGEQLAQVVSVTVLEQFRAVRAVLELDLQKIKYVLE